VLGAQPPPPAGSVPPGAYPPPGPVPPGAYPPPGGQPPPGQFPPGGQSAPPGGQPPPGGPRYPGAPRPLVRTREPRIIAGVCGGIARATNTDPILCRVVLAVLVFFGGIGALLYLLGWLLLPLEGESASPAEALIGRGYSSTSPVVAVLLGIGTVIALAAALNNGVQNVALLAAVTVGVVLLLRRTGHLPDAFPSSQPMPAGAAGYPPPPPPTQPPAGPAPTGPAPAWGTQPYSSPGPVGAEFGTPSYAAGSSAPTVTSYAAPPDAPSYGGAPTATLPGATAGPPAPPSTAPPGTAGPATTPGSTGSTGYSSPFAPRGPFQPPRPPIPPMPSRPPVPPRPPKQKSKLGKLTFAALCLALAGLGIIDLAGAHIPFTAYAATGLGVIALGLLVGTWFGRARLLIVLGLVFSVVLGVGYVGEKVGDYNDYQDDIYWRPTTMLQLQTDYELKAGNATLDLTALDFTDRSSNVAVKLGLGDLTILLPPKVDTTVDTKVGVGEARIFDAKSEGLGVDRQVTNSGIDGVGGGTLNLTVDVGVGSMEVVR
jgi:phage shock protein PspC (stress-responsive transcriptional regulator)